MAKKVSLEDKHCYYGVFLGFLYMVGNHQTYVKMSINDEDGVYPVQKMLYDYKMKGRMDSEIHTADNLRKIALDNLSKWGQKVGFLPVSEDGKQKILNFFENEPRRKYVRNRVQKALRTGELFSVADLMQERLEVEAKERKKEQAAGG